jgi:tetratricopeptide (TPR) repeat protein
VSDDLASSREYSRKGIEALDSGRTNDAEVLLAKAVATCPSNGEARQDYAASLWQRGAKMEAVAQIKQACRLMPGDAAMHGQLAEMQLALGQAAAARRSAETAIRLNPKLPAAWAVRGRVMWAAGDLPQALADLQRALGGVPYDQRILLDLAELYRQMDQPQRALETLQSLADTYSPTEEPQQVLYLQGLAYIALGRHDDAVESFASAAARDKPSPEILYRLAQAQWLAGRPIEAATTAQQALAMDPRHQPTLQLRASMQMAQQPESPTRR